MRRSLSRGAVLGAMLATLALGAGCGGAGKASGVGIDEAERVRASAAVKQSESLAPAQYAAAERERALSKQAHDQGDETAAQLHAERAVAAYEHAVVLARLARATKESTDAKQALETASSEAQKAAAEREAIDREAEGLEKQVKIAREQLLPAPSGATDPAREAARLAAARSLAMQARLLCDAARLLRPDVGGLADADGELVALDKRLDGGGKPQAGQPEAIDGASRARAGCLTVLTRARRSDATVSTGQADALLSELSASGGWDPSRDERGVIITLRDAFKGGALTADADSKLKELGRVAAAHPGFALQVVLHDATAPSAAEAKVDADRADLAAKALVAGGANASKVKSAAAGAKAPIVDPADATRRARNARLEIVFVSPTN